MDIGEQIKLGVAALAAVVTLVSLIVQRSQQPETKTRSITIEARAGDPLARITRRGVLRT